MRISYKAIWQIFSYLTALTAAIVAFGANNLPSLAVVFVAPLPLLFWLLAIYIPMDFYGNQSRKRLADMESGIDINFLTDYPETLKLKHFLNFTQQSETLSNQLQQSKTLSNQSQPDLLQSLKNLWQNLNDPWKTHWRVREAVWVSAGVVILAWLIILSIIIKLEPPVQVQTQAPQLQRLESELISLSDKLDSIESLLRTRNVATPNNNLAKTRY